MNKFLIKGKIISVRRLNDGRGFVTIFSKNGVNIYPQVFCSLEILEKIENLPYRAHVCIEGYVNSRKINGKRVQQFVATAVDKDVTYTEEVFGVKGKFFKPSETYVYLSGEIVKMFDNDKYLNLVVKTRTEDGVNSSILTSLKKPDRMPNIEIGNSINLVCSVSTPIKKDEVNGTEQHFEDIVVLDFAMN
ncbi:hypothetical protein [Lachnospira multipara]|uniref:Uncharacterized protein n=1 Tax=Lachnospira multipara TaxID=28051 RepID=A0A1H5VV40_9FIRM|nr:hypothetical protein [Lachnospira multipara]SEF90731.1 hypothetical protein SAMN05216537_11297 [Lachnospira multipara]